MARLIFLEDQLLQEPYRGVVYSQQHFKAVPGIIFTMVNQSRVSSRLAQNYPQRHPILAKLVRFCYTPIAGKRLTQQFD